MSASCNGAMYRQVWSSLADATSPPHLIALTGPAGCGKTTIARQLADREGFRRVRFAGPLKAALRAIGLSEAQVDGDEKEIPCDLLCGQTPRHAMQTLGVEWGREQIGVDLWTNAAMMQVARLRADWQSVVIDDCRFANEAQAVREAGGHVVYLTGTRSHDVPTHASERGIDPGLVSAVVPNDGTPEQVMRAVLRACGLV